MSRGQNLSGGVSAATLLRESPESLLDRGETLAVALQELARMLGARTAADILKARPGYIHTVLGRGLKTDGV